MGRGRNPNKQKFYHPLGRQYACCICGLRVSSSRFIKWNIKYTEDDYIRVFDDRLGGSMAGRKGYICNPCVLHMKRALQKLDAGIPPHKITGLADRLDIELKKKDIKIQPPSKNQTDDGSIDDNNNDEVDEADDEGHVEGRGEVTTDLQRERHGYFRRHRTFRPRYIYTGKKYIHQFSGYQVAPAKSWKDGRHTKDEDEKGVSAAERAQYRCTTLKIHRKTILQKQRERAKREAAENQRLFGDPDNDPQPRRRLGRYRMPSERINTRKQTRSQKPASGPDCGHSAASSVSDHMEKEKTTVENTEGRPRSGTSNSDKENPRPNGETMADKLHDRKKMLLWDSNDKKLMQNGLVDISDKEPPRDLSINALEEELLPLPIKKRRTTRQPSQGVLPPRVSFIDRTYFQKFQLCCLSVYVGEAGMIVADMSQLKHNCPQMRRHLQRKDTQLDKLHKGLDCSRFESLVEDGDFAAHRNTPS